MTHPMAASFEPAPEYASPAARRSAFADIEAAQRAIEFVRPMLERAVADESVNQSKVLHIVVMDPAMSPRDSMFEESILIEASFGLDRERWDADYAGFARAKARLSWETGCDTHSLQMLAPQRLRTGDSKLWGSVALDGIVVAVSGCLAVYDEALAGSIALTLRAEAKIAAAERLGRP